MCTHTYVVTKKQFLTKILFRYPSGKSLIGGYFFLLRIKMHYGLTNTNFATAYFTKVYSYHRVQLTKHEAKEAPYSYVRCCIHKEIFTTHLACNIL